MSKEIQETVMLRGEVRVGRNMTSSGQLGAFLCDVDEGYG